MTKVLKKLWCRRKRKRKKEITKNGEIRDNNSKKKTFVKVKQNLEDEWTNPLSFTFKRTIRYFAANVARMPPN